MRTTEAIGYPSRQPESRQRVVRTDGRTNEERDEDLIIHLSNRHACARRPELLRRLAVDAGLDINAAEEDR